MYTQTLESTIKWNLEKTFHKPFEVEISDNKIVVKDGNKIVYEDTFSMDKENIEAELTKKIYEFIEKREIVTGYVFEPVYSLHNDGLAVKEKEYCFLTKYRNEEAEIEFSIYDLIQLKYEIDEIDKNNYFIISYDEDVKYYPPTLIISKAVDTDKIYINGDYKEVYVTYSKEKTDYIMQHLLDAIEKFKLKLETKCFIYNVVNELVYKEDPHYVPKKIQEIFPLDNKKEAIEKIYEKLPHINSVGEIEDKVYSSIIKVIKEDEMRK